MNIKKWKKPDICSTALSWDSNTDYARDNYHIYIIHHSIFLKILTATIEDLLYFENKIWYIPKLYNPGYGWNKNEEERAEEKAKE